MISLLLTFQIIILKNKQTFIMATTQKLRPAIKFGPGYFIKEQMEYRSWTQEELAEVMGMTIKHINQILKDKQSITLDTAKVLAEVFDTSPQYWINLDSNYRLWLNSVPSEKEKQAELKANIYERMPVRDMIAKSWIPHFSNVHELCENILDFWNLKKLDFDLLKDSLEKLEQSVEPSYISNLKENIDIFLEKLNTKQYGITTTKD